MDAVTALYIKVCGFSSDRTVDAAVQVGVQAIGFVLVPSARQVSVELARTLAARVPASIDVVAVVREVDDSAVHDAISIGARFIQGGGQAECPPSLLHLRAYLDDAALDLPIDVDPVLVDGPRAGSGTPADWARVSRWARRRPLILAGGLCPSTVGSAIAQVRPYGVDVSSGIESALGEKDPELIRAFVVAARAAHALLSSRDRALSAQLELP
ncbi:MAG: phosphoribosylanthranilate isomerase [Kiritimatiellia bacterium]